MAQPENASKSKPKAIHVGARQVALVYAKAFLGACEKSGQSGQLIDELSAVAGVLEQSADLEAVLASALVGPEEKVQIVDRLFGSRLSPTVVDFLRVLARHGRVDLVRVVDQEVLRLYDESQGRVRVEVHTAQQLEKSQGDRLAGALRQFLSGEPKVEPVVNPALIGGILLRVGDTVYDGSVARQLNQAREQMIHRSIHEIQSGRDRFRHSGGN
jgi:F-type H+-transporting ATPase subunit delta